MGLVVDFIILLVIVIFAVWGQKKGLTGVFFKIVNFFLSLIIVFIIYKPVANFVMDKTAIDEALSSRIQEILMNTELSQGEFINEDSTQMSKVAVQTINKVAKDAIDNNKGQIVEYVSAKIAKFIISGITLILILMASKFALGFIKSITEFVAKLPLLNTFNESGGLIYGFLKGIFIVYIVLAVLSITSPLTSKWKVIEAINESKVGARMYDNNIILKFISK